MRAVEVVQREGLDGEAAQFWRHRVQDGRGPTEFLLQQVEARGPRRRRRLRRSCHSGRRPCPSHRPPCFHSCPQAPQTALAAAARCCPRRCPAPRTPPGSWAAARPSGPAATACNDRRVPRTPATGAGSARSLPPPPPESRKDCSGVRSSLTRSSSCGSSVGVSRRKLLSTFRHSWRAVLASHEPAFSGSRIRPRCWAKRNHTVWYTSCASASESRCERTTDHTSGLSPSTSAFQAAASPSTADWTSAPTSARSTAPPLVYGKSSYAVEGAVPALMLRGRAVRPEPGASRPGAAPVRAPRALPRTRRSPRAVAPGGARRRSPCWPSCRRRPCRRPPERRTRCRSSARSPSNITWSAWRAWGRPASLNTPVWRGYWQVHA